MKGTAFYKVISQAVIPATHTQTHTEMHKGTLAERILHPYTATLSQKENKPQNLKENNWREILILTSENWELPFILFYHCHCLY